MSVSVSQETQNVKHLSVIISHQEFIADSGRGADK